MTIKFGTDGWRGVIAADFNFDSVALCAQGVTSYLQAQNVSHQKLLVGYDTRFASREFAQRVAEVLAGNGVEALLCSKAAPTPVVSYNILVNKAVGAVVVTASHNPYQWNGIKFKPEYGGSASAEIVARLEEHIGEAERGAVKATPLGEAMALGLVREIDPVPPYMEQISRLVDLGSIGKARLKIIVDSMHGAGGGYLPRLLEDAKGSLLEIRGEPNPAFPGMQQPEPLAHNLPHLSELVVAHGADVGIAYDGDADRLGIIDERGSYLNTHQVFALLALYLLDVKGERGPLVKSSTSSDMIFKLGKLYRVPVLETGVGFKYIGPLMMKESALIGGEESGGYGFRGHIPERDGILSSLLLLEFMVRKGMRPSELLQYLYSKVGEHYYRRRDVPFPADDRPKLQQRLNNSGQISDIAGMRVTSGDTIDGWRFRFDGGWLAIRFSGTEPLVRIYAEADTPDMVDALLEGATALLGL